MNRISSIFIIFVITLISINVSYSQIPTYNLEAKNFMIGTENVTDDKLEFDIYILHTNAPTKFEYSGGQFFIKINPLVASGGTMTYSIIGSDLPPSMQPRSPSIGTAVNPSATVLRLAANVFPGAGNGFTMTGNTFPGTKIIRMKLVNTTSFNRLECFDLEWRNPPVVAFVTKIFAYLGLTNTEITTSETHFLSSADLKWTCLTPVELISFNSLAKRNNVTLSWSTSEEINNSGFDIERKYENAQWNKIVFVEGNGNTSGQKDYTFTDGGLSSGKYNYRLKQIDYNGNFEYYYLENTVEVGIPGEFSLSQNYPNPFNPTTKIDFDLPKESNVKIFLYDISGREVATLINEFRSAGYHSILFNGGNLSSGMYFYRIVTDAGFTGVKKMMLLK